MKTLGDICAVIAIVIIFIVLSCIPLFFLWNWLMPALFGLPTITLAQSLGLLILSSILFKSNSVSNDKS